MELTVKEYAQKIATEGPELAAFRLIDGLGGFIWRLNHDMADGRIPENEWSTLDASIVTMKEAQKIVFDSLTKYGLPEPLMFEGRFSQEYWQWYHWWKNYIKSMPNDDYDRLCKDEEKDNDLSTWRPEGRWQDQEI